MSKMAEKTSDKTHKTATTRTLASAPAVWLHDTNRLVGRVLDYGCGRGKDAQRFALKKYDPHYFPAKPMGKFDTILCTYVLNVLPSDIERSLVVHTILHMLRPGGIAYFTVRRDIPKEGTKTQYWVEMPEAIFPKIREIPKRYAIYEGTK